MTKRTAIQGDPFHLHLVSDATGETLAALARAGAVQFETHSPIEHLYALVRTSRQLDRALAEIEANPGIVMFTMVSEDLRVRLETRCAELGTPCVAVLDPVLNALENFLGSEQTHRPARQHQMDDAYFDRIEALNFTMAHDDGQNTETLGQSDVVLIGVSRTSKTPTCIYLANRGVKAGNIPLVPGVPLPDSIFGAKGTLVVGLTVAPERLVRVRRNRLITLGENAETDYTDPDAVKREVVDARRLFTRNGWPVIDVSRRSIEETAAAVLNLLQQRKDFT